MARLDPILWNLYLRGDPRISVLESFQSKPFTYVKLVVNDGEHDIVVQVITEYPFPFDSHKDDALKNAIHSAIKKVVDIITAQILAPVIAEFSNAPV